MLTAMAGGIGKSRKRGAAKAAGISRWLWAGGGVTAIAAVGLAAAALLPMRGDETAQIPAGQCPHYDVDPSTGNMRYRGLAACDGLAQNGRIDLIRKSFSER